MKPADVTINGNIKSNTAILTNHFFSHWVVLIFLFICCTWQTLYFQDSLISLSKDISFWWNKILEFTSTYITNRLEDLSFNRLFGTKHNTWNSCVCVCVCVFCVCVCLGLPDPNEFYIPLKIIGGPDLLNTPDVVHLINVDNMNFKVKKSFSDIQWHWKAMRNNRKKWKKKINIKYESF